MDTNFAQIDFGPLKPYLEDDDVTDISYDNDGQIHLKTLSKGIFRVENPAINNSFMEKLAFQCSNVMGKTFNMAHPFLDAESAELRLAFIHESVARNGVACVVRKTPAKIRLQKEKILADKYVELDILDFLEQCVLGHCNMIVSGETGSGKTELVKYLASKIAENEKIITVEDTLELHLDRIFPHRDIVSMKTNNIATYTDILEACMRQNPKWILLSEVRSAEAVMAIRNSISSGHYILSTIHADKAASIPNRMYSLLETNQDLEQFMSSICRYIQIGIYVRGYTDKATHNFKREIAEVTEFYVTSDTNKAGHNVIYRKGADGKVIRNNPSPYLIDYLEVQGVFLPKELQNMTGEAPDSDDKTINIQEPLSEKDISDNQTVIFNSEGATIETNNLAGNDVKNKYDYASSGEVASSSIQGVEEPVMKPLESPVQASLISGVAEPSIQGVEEPVMKPLESPVQAPPISGVAEPSIQGVEEPVMKPLDSPVQASPISGVAEPSIQGVEEPVMKPLDSPVQAPPISGMASTPIQIGEEQTTGVSNPILGEGSSLLQGSNVQSSYPQAVTENIQVGQMQNLGQVNPSPYNQIAVKEFVLPVEGLNDSTVNGQAGVGNEAVNSSDNSATEKLFG